MDLSLTSLVDGLQLHQLHDHDPNVWEKVHQCIGGHGNAEHEDGHLLDRKPIMVVPVRSVLVGPHVPAMPLFLRHIPRRDACGADDTKTGGDINIVMYNTAIRPGSS